MARGVTCEWVKHIIWLQEVPDAVPALCLKNFRLQILRLFWDLGEQLLVSVGNAELGEELGMTTSYVQAVAWFE